MKVDMTKLMEPKKQFKFYKWMTGAAICFTVYLVLAGGIILYRSTLHNENASADELYDETLANPSFTVQHVGDITVPEIQTGEGTVNVLTNEEGIFHAELNEDRTIKTITDRKILYDDYKTNWQETNSIETASFLNGTDGLQTEGYILKEIWFGHDKDSLKQSDFLVLNVPKKEKKADLSCILLTNNPNHPGLSQAADGYYKASDDNNYIICIQDGDVIRLIFETENFKEHDNANVFDYDVSDGGYYLESDYDKRKELHATSDQNDEEDMIYVDAIKNGIHSNDNYSGNKPKLAFGGADIGTGLADETLSDGLDTINIWNFEQYEGKFNTGITKNLVSGITSDGNIKWNEGISAPALFDNRNIKGRTNYTNGQYSFIFKRNGFLRTLSTVESEWGMAAEELEITDNPFWILDTAPSYGTDGHDPVWGNGSRNISYYKGDGLEPEAFKASDDGLDHNSFYGFAYSKDFTLSPGYAGPLDFFGYSDDDMWVFAGRVDDNGKVITDTVVPVADLGGVHDGIAYYCDMWDVIGKIPYGEEAQNWRLFVYWLERDGSSAKCHMNFTLPDAAIMDEKTDGSIVIEAADYHSVKGETRTFILDDGTYNRYKGTYDNGKNIDIVSGEEFIIPSGSFINISGLNTGSKFTIKETGRSNVWYSADESYMKGDTAQSVVSNNTWIKFISTINEGTLTITADAAGNPKNGYAFNLILEGMKSTEISAMDGYNNPLGSRFTDEDGQLVITIAAGETLMLYNLPECSFRLEPQTTPGWHISEILLDGADASGYAVVGEFPSHIIYRYTENEIKNPQITIEQSFSDDWDISDIVALTGTLLSYKITVNNPNDIPMDMIIEDAIPDGLKVIESSLRDGKLENGTLKWNLTIGPNTVTELFFTCEVTEKTGKINNSARILMDNKTVNNSDTVTVNIL